jgi:4-azaleucine resistance transporter AzlC
MFWHGFRAMFPLYLGLIPFSLAFAVIARAAGLDIWQTQGLSTLVFAGASQFSAANMFGAGASGLAIVLTTLLLNARHLLYGLSLSNSLPKMTLRERILGAFLLTDEAFGVAVAQPQADYRFYLGAAISLYFIWNLSTLLGALLGNIISDPLALGADLVFPLSFIALLVPLLRRWPQIVVAVVSGLLAWLLVPHLPGGLGILLVGVFGSLLGAWLTRNESDTTNPEVKA